MTTIIVATDFSPTADNATRYAIAAAKEIKARVVLFHLYKISTHAANSLISAHKIDEMAAKKKAEYDRYSYLLSKITDVDVHVEVRLGDFLDELEQVVTLFSGDMLVIGMPKKSYEQDLLGNTTTAAIYKFKFPILAIPQSARYSGIKKILFACDMTRGVHKQVLDNVKRYAQLFGAQVEVYYIGDALKRVDKKEDIDLHLEDVDFYYKSDFPSGSVVRRIQEEAENTHADILIMTPHKYGFWSSIFHRSKTRAMASNGKIPLLSLSY